MPTQLRTGGLVPLELAALVIAHMQPKVDPTMQQGETHTPVSCNERENALVILDARGIEGFDGCPVHFGGFAIGSDAPEGLLCQVGGEAKAPTDVIVEHGLHAHDIGDAVGYGGVDIGAGIGKRTQGFINVRGFFVIRLDFAYQRQCLFHAKRYISLLKTMEGQNAA